MPLPPDEHRISLSQAASKYPGSRGATRLHVATLGRWIMRGVRSLDGRLVRLEAERIGSRWCTSVEALARFSAALGAPSEAATDRTPAGRKADAGRAGAALEKMGY